MCTDHASVLTSILSREFQCLHACMPAYCTKVLLNMHGNAVSVQVYLQRMPALAGKTFGELVFHLPQATAYGLVQTRSRRCLLNPPAETVIDKLDEIVMIRATDLSEAELQPLSEPADVDIGEPSAVAMGRPARPHYSIHLTA